ncbi:hypothetical protein SBA1_500053 [Candidatus Sulfotelmatobacter kueseliae]|uniref:Uncharacterized protein n=1 Tax=Candidatus Sulfotelmatobacter kueseliae TaxID=2042962 RepID=A0A2U3KW88_9BACT|nr:hypothetical protein SBA1_500053 [Candidatus Sulfotelmatobacter kueseliae]
MVLRPLQIEFFRNLLVYKIGFRGLLSLRGKKIAFLQNLRDRFCALLMPQGVEMRIAWE